MPEGNTNRRQRKRSCTSSKSHTPTKRIAITRERQELSPVGDVTRVSDEAADCSDASGAVHGAKHTEDPSVSPGDAGAKRTSDSLPAVMQRSNSTPEEGKRSATSNWKLVRQAVTRPTRVALPRFTLGSSFLHCMISYRVATEGASGNNLSFELYKKIRELSVEEDDVKIPQYAWGTWPMFAKKPADFHPQQAKVYLDRECLQDGIDWELGFIQGLASSMVMVCLLSFNEDDRGSLGDLITLRPEEGKDRVDNVLLELIVGLELRALGEHTALSSILPILVGPQRQDSSFGPFPLLQSLPAQQRTQRDDK